MDNYRRDLLFSKLFRKYVVGSIEQSKLKKFVKYLKRTYFNEQNKRTRYDRARWDFYSLALGDNFNFSTNPIENLNGRIKRDMAMGRLPFRKMGRKLNKFHEKQIGSYISNVKHNKAPKRKKSTVERENLTREILAEFHNLGSLEEQMTYLPEFCLKFSCATKDYCNSTFLSKFSDVKFNIDSDSECESDSDMDTSLNDNSESDIDYDELPDLEDTTPYSFLNL